MQNNILRYLGITAFLGILIIGTLFILSQRQSPLSNNQGNIIEESYGFNEDCSFTIYKPLEESSITPDPEIAKAIRCTFQIHESLSLYTFQIVGERGENDIKRIHITQEEKSQDEQIFSEFDTYPSVGRTFEPQDINFDGYQDIRTLAWFGSAGFAGYQYWIFNPENGTFRLDEELIGLTNPKPDPATQTILADNPRDGGAIRYKWEDDKLIRDE